MPGFENQYNTSVKGELFRKFIHFSSASIPIGYLYLDKKSVLTILLPVLAALLFFEVVKYFNKSIFEIYYKLFGELLRNHESDRKKIRITGASWLLISDVLCIILFPKLIAVTGMLVLSLSDSISALVGKHFAKKQFAPNRSYLGSFTFLNVSILIVVFSPKYLYLPLEYILGFSAVLVTTIADSINIPIDDNFTIPIVTSGLLYLLYLVFLPGIFT